MSLVQTMTPTQARANLSALLRKALTGHEIGIVCNGQIVALRPVEVTATDYARLEYDLTEDEMKGVSANLHAKAKKALKAGKARPFAGDIEKALGD